MKVHTFQPEPDEPRSPYTRLVWAREAHARAQLALDAHRHDVRYRAPNHVYSTSYVGQLVDVAYWRRCAVPGFLRWLVRRVR